MLCKKFLFYLFNYIIQHCFCSECIESWLFNKRNHCPLCRSTVNLENYDNETWDIIDYSKEDRIYDANVEFYSVFHKLFLENQKFTSLISFGSAEEIDKPLSKS